MIQLCSGGAKKVCGVINAYSSGLALTLCLIWNHRRRKGKYLLTKFLNLFVFTTVQFCKLTAASTRFYREMVQLI